MNRTGLTARSRLATALCALACSVMVSCATAPELTPPSGVTAVSAPVIKTGQFWEYAVRDGYTGFARRPVRYAVTQTDGSRIVVDTLRDGERVDTDFYAPGWNGIELPLTNLQRFRFDPAFPAFEFPLYPGKGWRRVVRATDVATGRTYSVHVHARVGGWRRITVPAGEFDALEVTRAVYAGNQDFFKLQEEIVQTDWYAPSIGYVVMSEGSSSHLDTSRASRGRPLRVRGDRLVAELVRYSAQ